MELPEVRIATTFLDAGVCAVCTHEWRQDDIPVPTAYTMLSIETDNPPAPVCDHCIEKHYPETFAELMEERQRFWRE